MSEQRFGARVRSLRVSVPDEQLADLHHRLLATRWPDVEGLRSRGVPVFRLRSIVHHWLHHYDWRAREGLFNAFGGYSTVIDDSVVDFLHVRSSRSDALPILLLHGWPGSVLEFEGVIRSLAEPAGPGAEEWPAFHVVVPCLPGSSFSLTAAFPGWSLPRTVSAWSGLMQRLGYDRWVAHGGASGAKIAAQLGLQGPEGLVGIHLVPYDDSVVGPAEPHAIDSHVWDVALGDSPAGLAAWMLEAWTPWPDSDAEQALVVDHVLDSVMMYWLAAANSPVRDRRRLLEEGATGLLTVPVGCSDFSHRTRSSDEIWTGLSCRDLFYWNEPGPAARFPAIEQPDVLVSELRRCFATRSRWTSALAGEP